MSFSLPKSMQRLCQLQKTNSFVYAQLDPNICQGFWQAAKASLGCRCVLCVSGNGVWRTPWQRYSRLCSWRTASSAGTPLSQWHCYLSTGPPDTVADLCIQGSKQQWHRDTPGAKNSGYEGSCSHGYGYTHKYQNDNSFTVPVKAI